ncbi:hypothetical protein CROQUDRAFT_659147 [Cronartium quercuum f. sp. fusiforme G11]|uniref:Extracellular metalloproteinase n=1 Tax=Cronartium quercuum f. sp. fusiforme G11 TaxID=708437 RepID=A0A9P6NJ11_9BASI|nr:hypothetical protein CROQUDRAFT_659147 [Cronartium quercuum f. sp. fusiforme G11]
MANNPSSILRSISISTILLSLCLQSLSINQLPPSSPRKSINYGPLESPEHHLHTSIFSTVPQSDRAPADRLATLLTFNSGPAVAQFARTATSMHAAGGDASSLKELGIQIASKFITQTHPSLTYKLSSAYVSKHTNVLHCHFVQTLPIGPGGELGSVSNALANFNLDLRPTSKTFGHILSYSDSFHPLESTHELVNAGHGQPVNLHHVTSLIAEKRGAGTVKPCKALQRKFAEALEQAEAAADVAGQQVLSLISLPTKLSPLGNSLLSAFSESELLEIAGCDSSEDRSTADHSTHREKASAVVDPRLALVSFLTMAADEKTDAHLRSRSIDDIVDSIEIVTPRHFKAGPSPHSVQLLNVPGMASKEEPTAAELAWLSVEHPHQTGARELQLVWRFEYRSHANWYESYVDATRPGLVPMVVDWVKDFRPTTETAETYAEHLAITANVAKRFADRPAHTIKAVNPDSIPDTPARVIGEARPSSYRVFPWSVNDPTEAKREIVKDPSNNYASPLGWHSIPQPTHGLAKDISKLTEGWAKLVKTHGLHATDTRGNNVFAQENWEGLDNWESNYRPNGTDDLCFEFHLGWNKTENKDERGHIEPKQYIDAAISELFYTCNSFHDLTHRYGFDEESGNFQEHNYGRGGKGGDAVIANAQDGSGYNNANFATPPDGRHGQMRMYVWNGAEPWRDGDLEAGIVIHEYSHGVSTRLTGGPANSGCLGWGEAGGMGEGWGDAFATLIRMHAAKPIDYTMGEWASGMKGGIRKYKYSLNNTVNPETYNTLDKPGYWGVHAIGEVWAEMLFTLVEALIEKHGFEPSLFPSDTPESDFYKTTTDGRQIPRRGNTLFFQLVLDGMKLQRCRPSFINARDAIIEADVVLTGGENVCEIWKAFASRGLGKNARVIGSTPWGGGVRTEDYSMPIGVC